MKRLLTLFVAGATVLAVNAQAVEGQKFLDNWSLGIYGGGVTPTTHHSIISNTRGVAGLELTKALTPYFGLGVQATAGINTTGSHTVFDNLNALLVGKFNFSNLFCGYPHTACGDVLTGKPRFFEVVGVAGIGFNKFFGHTNDIPDADGIHATSKFGLELNFNLGSERAWTIGLRPAIVYDLEGGEKGATKKCAYNVNNSVLELTAGVTYHFKSSNGHHHFTYVRPYDQAEVDGLNAKINDLRGQLGAKDQELRDKDAELRRTQQQLNDCRNQKPAVQQVVNTNKATESVVTFRQGKSTIDNSQLPNVERVATYMKSHKDAKVVIKGYASPEGSAEINNKLSTARANAVRDCLVKKYKISSDRISAEGQGVGNLFSEPDWNRVSICTIEEAK